jgi:hypothetical protein
VQIIEEVEASHKGLNDEKFLNNNEKYKLGLIYIEMLEKPDDFKFLDRLAGDNDSNKV